MTRCLFRTAVPVLPLLLGALLSFFAAVALRAAEPAQEPPGQDANQHAAGTVPEGLVNLARLGITRVLASSVNGDRPQDDKFYGVRNLFDAGGHFINNLNYDYWLSSSGERHDIRIRFDKPVTVYSVVVELMEDSGVSTVAVGTYDDHMKPLAYIKETPVTENRGVLTLPKPQEGVSMVGVIFSCKGTSGVRVREIEVYGRPPAGVDLTPVKPGIIEPFKGIHEMKVVRNANTEEEKRMLAIAENTYPPREEVLGAFEKEKGEQAKAPEDEKLWWYSTFDDIRIPYAVTAEAVDYYTALTEEYRKKSWQTDIKPQSNFEYNADVTLEKLYKTEDKTFEDVYVVRLRLRFGLQWATLDGVHFGKERTVILDRSGKVLFVSGDGKTRLLVS